jgi:chemotaxis protein CheX
MDVKIINPFLDSTVNLFRTMFSLEIQANPPYLLENFLSHRWEISGIVAVTGITRGVVAIRMHHLLVNKILEKSGVTVDSDEERFETINAMVGELINIISGNAISEMPYPDIDISVPMIVQGNNHRIAWPKIAPVVGIPFPTNWGIFEVQVCFQA